LECQIYFAARFSFQIYFALAQLECKIYFAIAKNDPFFGNAPFLSVCQKKFQHIINLGFRKINFERKEQRSKINFERKEQRSKINFERKEQRRKINFERKEQRRKINFALQ